MRERTLCAYRVLWKMRLKVSSLERKYQSSFFELWDAFGLPRERKSGARMDVHMVDALTSAGISRIRGLLDVFARDLSEASGGDVPVASKKTRAKRSNPPR